MNMTFDPKVDARPGFLKAAFSDPSLYFLILTNTLVGAAVFWYQWPLINLMWIYWFQSVIIGYFNYKRMNQLEHFSTKGLKFNGRFLDESAGSKFKLSRFFVLHYGIFHLVYAIFLTVMLAFQDGFDFLEILGASLGFFLNHRFSYAHQSAYQQKAPNIGLVMMYPYARIIPMHLVIILGISLQIESVALVIFVVLKTLADLVMHIIEHRLWLR